MTATKQTQSMRLLAFGGPWNEQLIDVPENRSVYFAPRPVTLAGPLTEGVEPIFPETPKATYTVEKVGYHFADLCIDQNIGFHSDDCRWTAMCLVVEGYPRQRITDALNAIVGLCRIGAEHFAGLLIDPPDPVTGTVSMRYLIANYPEFVQWVVARYGPLPDDGEVTEAVFTRWADEYRRGR